MVGYFSRSLQGKSRVYVGQLVLCCFQVPTYVSTYTHGALIGTYVFTQNLPASIFQANKFACTRRAKCK